MSIWIEHNNRLYNLEYFSTIHTDYDKIVCLESDVRNESLYFHTEKDRDKFMDNIKNHLIK